MSVQSGDENRAPPNVYSPTDVATSQRVDAGPPRSALRTAACRLPVAGHRCCHPHCIAATPLLRDGSALS